MENKTQLIIPINEVEDISIIAWDAPLQRGYGVKRKYEVAIIGPEGTYPMDVQPIYDAEDLALYLQKLL